MFTHQGYNIRDIAIVDDQPSARESMSYVVLDADLVPYKISNRIGALDELVKMISGKAQAAIFDHHLSVGNYANFTGAHAVSELYKKKVPALLVTAYSDSDVDNIRIFRNHIPAIYNGGEFEPEDLSEGLKICIEEFNNNYSIKRKPYRELFRIVELDVPKKFAYIIIPSWDSNKTVRIPFEVFGPLQTKLSIEQRFYAKINIGAETHDELYLSEIEIAQKPMGRYASFIRS